MYHIVHNETGKSILMEQERFDRNKILEESSKKLGTKFNKDKYGEYKIHPQM